MSTLLTDFEAYGKLLSTRRVQEIVRAPENKVHFVGEIEVPSGLWFAVELSNPDYPALHRRWQRDRIIGLRCLGLGWPSADEGSSEILFYQWRLIPLFTGMMTGRWRNYPYDAEEVIAATDAREAEMERFVLERR